MLDTNGQYVDFATKVINANDYLDKGNMVLPKLREFTICCTALKGHAALLICLLKKSTPSLLLFLKGMLPQSMLFQKVFALKLLGYWDFACF